MLQAFYREDCLVNLLEQNPGETVVFIGLKQEQDGSLLLYRHVNKNSMKYIETYSFNGSEAILVGSSPLNIQVSHSLYSDIYDTIILN